MIPKAAAKAKAGEDGRLCDELSIFPCRTNDHFNILHMSSVRVSGIVDFPLHPLCCFMFQRTPAGAGGECGQKGVCIARACSYAMSGEARAVLGKLGHTWSAACSGNLFERVWC